MPGEIHLYVLGANDDFNEELQTVYCLQKLGFKQLDDEQDYSYRKWGNSSDPALNIRITLHYSNAVTCLFNGNGTLLDESTWGCGQAIREGLLSRNIMITKNSYRAFVLNNLDEILNENLNKRLVMLCDPEILSKDELHWEREEIDRYQTKEGLHKDLTPIFEKHPVLKKGMTKAINLTRGPVEDVKKGSLLTGYLDDESIRNMRLSCSGLSVFHEDPELQIKLLRDAGTR